MQDISFSKSYSKFAINRINQQRDILDINLSEIKGWTLGMLRVATGRVGSGNSKFSTGRVGSGQQIWKFHGSGRVTGQPTIFQRVGGSKGKMLRVRRVKSRKFTGQTGQKFFTKIEIFCKFFCKINIDLTENRDFWPKSLRFCENISRKYITGNAGQEQFFSRV